MTSGEGVSVNSSVHLQNEQYTYDLQAQVAQSQYTDSAILVLLIIHRHQQEIIDILLHIILIQDLLDLDLMIVSVLIICSSKSYCCSRKSTS